MPEPKVVHAQPDSTQLDPYAEEMADADTDAKRQAAEARRAKILARGKDRLSKITVGTMLEQTDDDGAAAAPASAPEAAAAAPRAEQPATTATAEQPGPSQDVPVSSSQANQDAEAMGQKQVEAERALHQLLNHLAFADLPPNAADLASGAAGAGPPPSSQGMPQMPDLGAFASLFPGIAAGAPASGSGAAPAPGTPKSALASLGLALPSFLGPQLTALVQRTQAARCVASIMLAVALFFSVLTPQHLRLPPPLFLIFSQVMLIISVRMLTRPSQLKAAEAEVVPVKFRKFDMLSLIPGLREAYSSAYSALALGKALSDAVAVFLVTYALLEATMGGGRSADAGTSGRAPLS